MTSLADIRRGYSDAAGLSDDDIIKRVAEANGITPGMAAFELGVTPSVKAKPGLMSDVTRGFGQVVETTGSALRDVYEPLGGAVEEYGAGIVQRHPAEINSFQDVLDRPGTALREGFGEMGGQLPPVLAGVYAGGKAGLALSSAIPHPGAKALAAGAGAFIGAFAPSWIQEYGEIRKGQRESGQEDRGIAGVGATGAALVETALGPEAWMARSIGRKMGGKALSEFSEAGARDLLSSGFLKGAAKKGLQTGLIEGPLTEIPQTAMERWAQFKDVGGAEALDEYGVAGVKGFAGGAGIGTITAPMQRMRASSFVDQIDTAREAIQDPNMGQREKFEAAEFLQRVKANDEGDTVARDWHRAFQEAQLTDAYDQAVAEGDTIRRDVFAKQIEAIRFAREVEQKQSVDLLGAIEASTGLQAMQERLPMGIGQQVPSVVSVQGKEIPEVGVGGKVVGPDFGLTKAGQEYQQWWVDQQAIQDAQRTPGVMTDMFSGEMGFAPPVQRVEEPAPIAPVAGTKYVTAPPVTQGELFTPTGGVRKAAEEAKATSKAKAPPKAPTQKQQVQATVDALLASGEITQEQHKDWTNDLDQKKDPLKVRNEVNKFKEVKNAPKATETKVLKVPKETRTKVPVQTEGVKNGISSEVVPTGDKNLKKGSNLQTKENAVVPTAKTSEGSQTKAAKVVPSTPVPVDEIEDETHAEAVRMHLAGDALRPIADALGATAPTWNKILASYGYTAKGKQAADEAQAETGTSFSVDDPVANPASAAEVSENAGADLDTGDEVVKKGEGTVAALPGMKLRNVPNSGAPVLAVNDRTSVKEVKAAISAIPTPVRKRAEEQARDLGLSVATAPAQTQLVIYSAANEGRDVTAADVEQAKSLQVALTSASKGGETKLSAQEKAEAAAEKLAESKKVVDGLLEKLLGGDADAANDLVTLLNTDPNGSRLALTIRDAFSPPKQADTTLKLVGYLFNTAEQQRKERKVETASKFKTKAVSMGALIDGEWSVIPDEEIAQATNLLPNMGASVETILSEDEKAEVADHFQAEDSFGLATKKMFLKEYANWLHAGAKATHQLADIFRKVLKSVVSGVMSIAVAFNLSNTQVPEANATQLPVNKFTIERMYKSPKADFNGVDASADVKMVADWQVRKAGGKAFIIADKVGGLLYAFDTNGALVAKTPALYGADRGDVEVAANKSPDSMIAGEKITPAGVFAGRKPPNAEYGNGMVTFKEGANGSIAIHRVYLGDPKEKRTARLDSATAEDNRISYGCINVPAKFADEILEKHFSGASEVVVMPDTATLEDTFPMMSAADPIVTTEVRLGGKTDSSTEAAWGSDKYGKPEDVSLSRGAKDTTGTTVRKIKNALAKWFFSPELLASKVTIVQKWSDLPVEVRQKVEGSKKSSGDASGLVQGFVLNGQAYLIADNIDVGTERSVFMHEVGAHIGLTEKEEAFFASEIKGWAKSPEGSLERKIYEAVKKRMASAKERSDREWVAYATEESVNAGVKPGVVGKAAKWMRDLAIAVMNAVKLKMGIGRKLTAQDLVDYTYGAAGLALEGQRANAGAGVTLSKGGFTAVDVLSAAFKQWFGGSKVVGADGKPLRVFHGMLGPLQGGAFRVPKSKDSMDGVEEAVFFTDSKPLASDYAYSGDTSEYVPATWADKGAVLLEPWQSPTGAQGVFREVEGKSPGNVVPVYLSMQNPLVIDYAGESFRPATMYNAIKEAKRNGHDGVIMHNVRDGAKGESKLYRATQYAVFKPTQIKSAISNTGRFDANDPRISFSMSGAPSLDKAYDALKLAVTNPIRFMKTQGVGWLSLSHLVEVASSLTPSIKNYDATMRKMQMASKQWVAKAAAIDLRWATVFDASKLGEVMVRSTMATYDPSIPTSKPKNAAEQAVQDSFDALKPDAKKLYQDVRDHYKAVALERKSILLGMLGSTFKSQIAAANLAGDTDRAAKLEAKLKKEMNAVEARYKEMQGPYFPLMRLGRWYAVGMSTELRALTDKQKNGTATSADLKKIAELRSNKAHYETRSYDSERQALIGKADLSKRFPVTRYNIAQDKAQSAKTLSAAGLAEVDAAIDEDFDRATASKVKAMMAEMYYNSLPEHNVLKRQMKRDNVEGADSDMRRVFAKSSIQDAHYISRLKYQPELKNAMFAIKEEGSSNGPDANMIYNELLRRSELAMEQSDSPILDKMVNMSYFAHLGMNPAFILSNMTQVPMITLPWLAARYGTAGSTGAIRKAYADAYKIIESSYKDQGWRAELNWKGKVSSGEDKMLNEMLERNLLDITIEHDIAAVADMKNTKVGEYLRMANLPVHISELANRTVTALAAYRLAIDAKQTHAQASDVAAKALSETQLDYSALNAPRYLQSMLGSKAIARVAGQFRKYQQGMLWLIGKNMYDAVKGKDKDTQRIALRTLVGLFTTTGTMAGSLGMPAIGALFWLATAFGKFFDDDDEPFNAEVEYRNWLADMLGADVGAVVAKGLPMAVGMDMSKRVGLGDIAAPAPFMRTGGKTGQDTVSNALFAAAGAPVSMVANILDGLTQIEEGKWQKGAEKIVPLKLYKNLSAAERYASEGLTKRNGDLVKEMNAWDTTLRGLGFSPASESEYYSANAALEESKRGATDVRNRLLRDYAQGKLRGESVAEVEDSIKDFNTRHPEKGVRIDASSKLKAVNARKQGAKDQTESGVSARKANKPFLESARFAM